MWRASSGIRSPARGRGQRRRRPRPTRASRSARPRPSRRGRRVPGSRPRSRGTGRRHVASSASASAVAAAASTSATPMYSPAAAPRSTSLPIRRITPSAASTFISSSPSVFSSSTARSTSTPTREQGLFDARRVDGVAVRNQRAAGEGLTCEPVGVVPLLRALVEHELDPERVTALGSGTRSSTRSAAKPLTRATSSPTARKLARTTSRIVRPSERGRSVLGRSAVSARSRRPGPAAARCPSQVLGRRRGGRRGRGAAAARAGDAAR